jgi:hypothetical protein
VDGWQRGAWNGCFGLRDRLIEDYRDFSGSFVDIHDKTIADHVRDRMDRGYQWPDPWLSLNPNFASGGTIAELVAQGADKPAGPRKPGGRTSQARRA